MTRKLNEADRAAVDLLFDRTNAATSIAAESGNPGDSVFAMAGPVSEQRLDAVRKVLSLLDELPAVEPPADLASRTITRVNRASNDRAIPAIPPGTFADPSQPLA